MLSYFFSSFLHFVSIFSFYFHRLTFKKKICFLLGHISRFANNVKKYLIGVHNQTIYKYKTRSRIIKTNMNP